MSIHSTREAIIEAGRYLFGERGYSAVTIKDVAERAGYSPAMVMKVMGSKAELYAAAAPEVPSPEETGPFDEPLSYALVRRILARRSDGQSEPWIMAPMLVHDAPDPEEARAALSEKYIRWVAEQIQDTSPDKHKTKLVVCALMGLAAGVRTFGLLGEDEIPAEQLVQEYGAIVQRIIG